MVAPAACRSPILGHPACADTTHCVTQQPLPAREIGTNLRDDRQRTGLALGPLTVALSVVSAACGLMAASRVPDPGPPRPRAFVTTFERVLIAGFFAETIQDGRRAIDLNDETSRLIRMTLRSRASVHVVDSQPVHLRHAGTTGAAAEESVFRDEAFWKRLGDEYRQPLILTGRVRFKRAGPQSVERQIGPRTVTVWRPRFELDLRVVFICGRAGRILESLSLGPERRQASDERTSALAVYLELMDRLMPELSAVFGDRSSVAGR